MFVIQGKYTTAKVYAQEVEQEAISQITSICNHPAFADSHIAIMPDVHSGKGCVIGFTAPVKKGIIPNIVGVDIGCGILACNIGPECPDFEKVYEHIKQNIPHGFKVRSRPVNIPDPLLKDILRISKKTDTDCQRHLNSIGSLGGGNHFIEISKDSNNCYWVIIHSGSRHFGKTICDYHQKKAKEQNLERKQELLKKREEKVKELKDKGDFQNISAIMQKYKEILFQGETGQEYLTSIKKDEYLSDMYTAQIFAVLNRKVILDILMPVLSPRGDHYELIETVHNYIDKHNMIRKGAVAAHKNQQLIIPINMEFGSIIAEGKGNMEWNCSAPHGAGRLMSRNEAKKILSLKEFQDAMKNVWSKSVNMSTLDEAPGAYKNPEQIVSQIEDTVEIKDILIPVFSFKDSSL